MIIFTKVLANMQLDFLITMKEFNLFRNKNMVDSFPENNFLKQFKPNLDWLQNICQADVRAYMVDDILVKVDRMSMLNSLEVRCPLLDYRLAEFAFLDVAPKFKKGNINKYLLKQLGKRYLPKDFVYNRKHGFGVPLSRWFNERLRSKINRYF